MKPYRGADGTDWGVEVQLPTFSRALIVFHHPDGTTSRKDRYAWYDWHGPESNDTQAKVSADKVRAALNDRVIADLFRRSIPIGFGAPAFAVA
jgi:hypothetical protein